MSDVKTDEIIQNFCRYTWPTSVPDILASVQNPSLGSLEKLNSELTTSSALLYTVSMLDWHFPNGLSLLSDLYSRPTFVLLFVSNELTTTVIHVAYTKSIQITDEGPRAVVLRVWYLNNNKKKPSTCLPAT